MRMLFTLALAIAVANVSYADDLHATLQEIFKQTKIMSVQESSIPGLSQVILQGGKVIYYHEKSEQLVFGEIWTRDGISLTAEVVATAQAEAFKSLPLEDALVIGPENGIEIVEFTDPDCRYCKKLQKYFDGSDAPVKRVLFFETRIHPQTAPTKAIHILCSKDPEKAFNELYSGKMPAAFLDCETGRERLARHQRISKQVGVKGTPTLLLDGQPVTGFRQNVIDSFLREKQLLANTEKTNSENNPEKTL